MNDAAVFNNGRNAGRVAATLRTIGQGVEIRDAKDHLLLALWSYADLSLIERRTGLLRLTSRTDPDARLTVSSPGMITLLEQVMPTLTEPNQRRHPLLVWAVMLAAAALGAVLIYESLLWGARPLARMIPFAWEQKIGATLVERMKGQLGPSCTGVPGEMALVALTKRLTDAGGMTTPITIRVVKNQGINAFALPGGQIIILSGLIKDAQSPDEVAAVLAHELSHVALRHVTEQTIRHAGLSLVVMLLTGDASGLTAGAVTGLAGLSYSREAESQADAMGLQMLRNANISAQGMGNFFRRLEEHEKGRFTLPAFLSDHPASETRANTVPVQGITSPSLSIKQWLSLRMICD